MATNASGVLSSKAMVVKLSISRMGVSKKDEEVTTKVTNEYNTDRKAGTFNKKIFPKGTMDELNEICSKMRAYHTSVTLPWSDDGSRILPSKMFDEYNETMLRYKDKFNAFVDSFYNSYDEHLKKAMDTLGDMFNEDDYCTKEQIKGKFDIKFVYYPIPTSKDFRIDISTDNLSKIQEDIENDINSKYSHAMSSAWSKAKELIERLVSRLEDKDQQLKSRLIDSIKELLPVLETFNFTGDQKYTDLIREIRDTICIHTTKELNMHESKCVSVISDSKNILTKISDYSSMFIDDNVKK